MSKNNLFLSLIKYKMKNSTVIGNHTLTNKEKWNKIWKLEQK